MIILYNTLRSSPTLFLVLTQAQSRWNQVYQLLLEYFASQVQADNMNIGSEGESEEVKVDEDWSVCQGLQPAPGSGPNHRTTIGAFQSTL